jgi:hypothetical protein
VSETTAACRLFPLGEALPSTTSVDTIRSMFKKSDDKKIALNPSRLITEVLEVGASVLNGEGSRLRLV